MDESEIIISLTGFMGSGKTSVGRELASRLGCAFVDLDDQVSIFAGRSIPEIFHEMGETGFRALEIKALEKVLSECRPPFVLALGGGTFTIESAREILLAKTRCIFLDASEDEIAGRIGGDSSSRPLFDLSLLKKRLPFYRQAHYTINTDGLTIQQTVNAILERKIV